MGLGKNWLKAPNVLTGGLELQADGESLPLGFWGK